MCMLSTTKISMTYLEFSQIYSSIIHLQETQVAQGKCYQEKKSEDRSCGLKKYSEEFFSKN